MQEPPLPHLTPQTRKFSPVFILYLLSCFATAVLLRLLKEGKSAPPLSLVIIVLLAVPGWIAGVKAGIEALFGWGKIRRTETSETPEAQ